MLIEHLGKTPKVHKDAWIDPDATVCGDVRIGAGVRIMHGACLIAENGTIALGECCIVMENAVVRATGAHDCSIGNHVLIGPNAHVVGSRVKDEVFLATGATVLHGSQVGHNTVIQVNAWCTSTACCRRAPRSRSAGLPAATRPGCSAPTSATSFGPCSSRSNSR